MKDVANVITVSSDGTAKLWEVRSTECLLTFRLVGSTVCGKGRREEGRKRGREEERKGRREEERERGRLHVMSRDRSSLVDR